MPKEEAGLPTSRRRRINYARWLTIAYLLAIMVFSFATLTANANKYEGMTTSDSWWFYGISEQIVEEGRLIDNNRLSHAPQGAPLSPTGQLQPAIAAGAYEVAHALNPSVTLWDVCRFLPALFFVLSFIPVFLIGCELGGKTVGGLAVFLLATMGSAAGGTTAPVYWVKPGGFDCEAIQLLLGAWTMFLAVKMFKARDARAALKYGALGGAVLGLFTLAWSGAMYLAPIIVGGLVLIVLNELPRHRGHGVEAALWGSARANAPLAAGIVCMLGIATVAGFAVGGTNPWSPLLANVSSLFGGGLAFPAIASEETLGAAADAQGFYGPGLLTQVVFAFVALAALKVLWTRRREELVLGAWFIVVAAMALGFQLRFFRLWWPVLAITAAIGAVSLWRAAQWTRTSEYFVTATWLEPIRSPGPIAAVIILIAFAAPFMLNVQAAINISGPPMSDETYYGLMDASLWIRENTPEGSIVAVDWSHGHFVAAAARRPTVCDGVAGMVESGVWEAEGWLGARPPDYIYTVDGREALVRGVNAPISPGEINGRRVDVDRLILSADENEVAYYLAAYRDDYGCRIDYVVYHFDWAFSAVAYHTGENFEHYTWAQSTAEGVVFEFADTDVTYDGWWAYEEVGGDKQYLAGVVYMYLPSGTLDSAGGDLSKYSPAGIRYLATQLNYLFTPDPDVGKLLWIYYEGGRLAHAQLSDFAGAPMLVRVRGDLDVPAFLEVAHVSANGEVAVVRVHHVPSPSSPAEGALTNDNTPELTWYGAVGAATYQIQVDNDADFGSPLVDENVTTTAFTPENALADGAYWWRARAFDADGETLGWCDARSFTIDTVAPGIPSLISPADGLVENSPTPTFAWYSVEGADVYELRADNSYGFGSPEVLEDIADNEFTPAEPLADGVYWWKVRARDNAGNGGDWSDVWSLTINTLEPGVPRLVSPPDSAVTNDNRPFFTWLDAIGAASYTFEFDDNYDLSSPIVSDNTPAAAYLPASELDDGAYYWRVTGVDNENVPTGVSEAWSLIVDTAPPLAPELLSPPNNSQSENEAPTLAWSTVESAVGYNVEADDNSDFTSPEVSRTVAENSYALEYALPSGAYYWHVSAVDSAGNASDWSEVWAFAVEAVYVELPEE